MTQSQPDHHTLFKDDFAWQRKWIPRMKTIIGPHLLRESSFEEDTKEATDLIVLRADGVRIACRIRRPGYVNFNDITITCRRESGSLCEWDKMILDECADWFFYGHTTVENPRDEGADIIPRFLINLAITRTWMKQNHGPERGPNRGYIGQRCWFYAFDIQKLKAAIPHSILGERQRIRG